MYGPKASADQKQFEKIIDIQKKSKNDLYVSANTWFVDTFNSAGSVIQYQDKDAGKIMGKYSFSFQESMYRYNIKQTLALDVKDGKVRVRIYDPEFAIIGDSLNGTYARVPQYSSDLTEETMKTTKAHWLLLSSNLESALNKDASW
jgi:hypothetical protein